MKRGSSDKPKGSNPKRSIDLSKAAATTAPAVPDSTADETPTSIPRDVFVIDASEAIAVDTVAWIFEETFLYYTQCERAMRKVFFASRRSVSMIFATIHMGCYINYDPTLPPTRPEVEPLADAVDRHASQAVPKKEASRHPQRLYEGGKAPGSSARSTSERSLRTRQNAVAASRKVSKDRVEPKPAAFQILVHGAGEDGDDDAMDAETKAWRMNCLAELTTTKPSKTKWGKVSVLRHAIGHHEYVGMDSAVIEPLPSIIDTNECEAQQDVLPLDTVRTVPADETLDDASLLLLQPPSFPEQEAEQPVVEDKTRGGHNRRGGREAKTTRKHVKPSWFYETISVKEELKQERDAAYKPHAMALQKDAFARTIELTEGVSLVQGGTKYVGPHRHHSHVAMSRQGFQSHLGTQEHSSNKLKLRTLTAESSRNHSTTDLRALGHADSRHLHRSSASDLSKLTRHKAPSPSIRVRVSPLKADTANARPQARMQYVTHGDSVGVLDIPSHKRRPATAIGALATSPKPLTSKLKYMREFPPPKPEVVTVLKDQKLAWLS
ncbi:unnamed protein product [Aphanomyces euteiches]|uniref:Uncharacterized protein n=1 Tax=Aphanomyces euteiches TaxID=100861 RepID=A0A6G0XWL0_9STRA|nr:hypothetical protein Ae201684_000680 [Aphanomyces euteiches]KAH9091893.1 hypothetical protein Ae201684P_011436 [Aphanomyces euteiches]KAH9157133.1 hypothetical protein AeRB84_001006 [Aphanomyces euteiches]